VRAWNEQLSAGAPVRADIVEMRAEVLGKLMETDAAAAWELVLPEDAAQRARQRFAAAAAFIEDYGAWQGSITVLVEDHFDTHTSRTRTLLDAGGEQMEVFLPPGQPPWLAGQRVAVRGARLGRRLLVAAV